MKRNLWKVLALTMTVLMVVLSVCPALADDNPCNKQDNKEVPYDGSSYKGDGTASAAVAKPTMVIDKYVIEDGAEIRNKEVDINLNVTVPDNSASATGIVVFYDTRLTLKETDSVKKGDACKDLSFIFKVYKGQGKIEIATAGVDDKMESGVYCTLKFATPAGAKPGDLYPIGIKYIEGSSLFTNCNKDSAGKNMEAYFFTSGITNGYIKTPNAYSGKSGDCEWSFDKSTGKMTITGNGSGYMADYSDVGTDCPWYEYRNQIESIEIKYGVKAIGSSAFYGCKNLTSLSIANSVERIKGDAFSGCASLASVTLPQSLTKLGNNVFEDCSKLKNVTLSENMKEIPSFTFSGCKSLKKIKIPATVTKIEGAAFYDCTALAEVELPDSLTALVSSAFSKCSGLKEIKIPDGIKQLQEDTFKDCSKLTTVHLPAGMGSIGKDCFKGCTALADVHYAKGPADRDKIGIAAGNDRLTGATWHYGHVGDAFGSGLNWYLDFVTGKLTISGTGDMPDYESIGKAPWMANNDDIKAIEIGSGVTHVGAWSFCLTSAVSVTIADSVKSIGTNAFAFGPYLTDVKLGSGLEKIGDAAFALCAIKSIEIPASVTEIGKKAMGYDLTKPLEGFEIKGKCGTAAHTYAKDNGIAFVSIEHTWDAGVVTTEPTAEAEGVKTFTCPCGATKTESIPKAGSTADPGTTPGTDPGADPAAVMDEVTVSGGVYRLNHGNLTAVFIKPENKNAKKLTIPDTVNANGKDYAVREIKKGACKGMKKLTTLNLGANVTKIGASAFEACGKLKTITIRCAKMKKNGFGAKCFLKIKAGATFKVPKAMVKKYEPWILGRGKAPANSKVKKGK